jgi:Domain of unknown function (DUF4422)
MEPRADIWSINHVKIDAGTGHTGGVAREFIVGSVPCDLSEGYCDMIAPYTIWKHYDVSGIVGFHGYRKHINFRDRLAPRPGQLAPGWEEVSLSVFQHYQHWLSRQSAHLFNDLLYDVDVLCVEPFNCSYNGGMANDYAISRSPNDWIALQKVMAPYGHFDFDTPYIRPMHFVCRRYVFYHFMRFWDMVRRDLEPRVLSQDAVTPDYPKRAMAFLSERIWSLWLDETDLRLRTFPLLMCWDAR